MMKIDISFYPITSEITMIEFWRNTHLLIQIFKLLEQKFGLQTEQMQQKM